MSTSVRLGQSDFLDVYQRLSGLPDPAPALKDGLVRFLSGCLNMLNCYVSV